MTQFVSYILKNNIEKKALNILSTLRNLSTKYTKDELEQATQTLLEISTNPTVSVLKSILDRKKKQRKNKKKAIDNLQTHSEDYGFVRGAKYFGRDSK